MTHQCTHQRKMQKPTAQKMMSRTAAALMMATVEAVRKATLPCPAAEAGSAAAPAGPAPLSVPGVVLPPTFTANMSRKP